jgi:hypothetical protein
VKTSTAGIAALTVSVALGLTGCAGDSKAADPKVTTRAGSAATSPPSPAPTTTAPPTQSSTRASEEAAAIDLVQTFLAEYNKALQSGSTTAFRATFKESCAMCLAEAETIDGTFRHRQRLQGLQYAVASTLVVFNGVTHSGAQIWVQGQVSQAGGQILASSGTVFQSITPTVGFRVTWQVQPGSPPVIVGSFQ